MNLAHVAKPFDHMMQMLNNVHAYSFSVSPDKLASLQAHRIPPIRRQQVPRLARGIRQTPLHRLKVAALFPQTDKSGQSLRFCALDPKANVDGAMQLVQLASNPWGFAGKVDFVAENLARRLVGAECVHDRTDG